MLDQMIAILSAMTGYVNEGLVVLLDRKDSDPVSHSIIFWKMDMCADVNCKLFGHLGQKHVEQQLDIQLAAG